MEQGERLRVTLENWVDDHSPGGWVVPHDADTIVWWVVTRVYARYEAPRRTVRRFDPVFGEEVEVVVQRFRLRAYLVDLDAEWGLEPMKRVLLHQRPPEYWWHLRQVTDEELAEMEQYRLP